MFMEKGIKGYVYNIYMCIYMNFKKLTENGIIRINLFLMQ